MLPPAIRDARRGTARRRSARSRPACCRARWPVRRRPPRWRGATARGPRRRRSPRSMPGVAAPRRARRTGGARARQAGGAAGGRTRSGRSRPWPARRRRGSRRLPRRRWSGLPTRRSGPAAHGGPSGESSPPKSRGRRPPASLARSVGRSAATIANGDLVARLSFASAAAERRVDRTANVAGALVRVNGRWRRRSRVGALVRGNGR